MEKLWIGVGGNTISINHRVLGFGLIGNQGGFYPTLIHQMVQLFGFTQGVLSQINNRYSIVKSLIYDKSQGDLIWVFSPQ